MTASLRWNPMFVVRVDHISGSLENVQNFLPIILNQTESVKEGCFKMTTLCSLALLACFSCFSFWRLLGLPASYARWLHILSASYESFSFIQVHFFYASPFSFIHILFFDTSPSHQCCVKRWRAQQGERSRGMWTHSMASTTKIKMTRTVSQTLWTTTTTWAISDEQVAYF